MKTILILFVLFTAIGFFGCEANTDNNQTPVASDYIISENLFQSLSNTEEVSVEARAGKSTGDVTVYYRGIQGTTYPKSTVNPKIPGTFLVTFDVKAVDGWNAAIDLIAGNLNISGGGEVILFEIPITDIVGLIAAVGAPTFLPLLRMQNPTLNDNELIAMIPGLLWSGIPAIPGVFPGLAPLTTMNSLIGLVMPGLTYEALSLESDVNFYHDEDGRQEFKGTDAITSDTIFYSSIDFDLIKLTVMGGPERSSFTISALLDEISFSGSIEYPLTLNEFLGTVKSGMTYAILNDQGVNFFTAATGGTMNANSNITGTDMLIWSNWPLDDVASMF